MDSEGRTRSRVTHRTLVVDARRKGLFVKVKNLQFDDTGVYWVGIDKIYADIMTCVSLVVTEGLWEGFSPLPATFFHDAQLQLEWFYFVVSVPVSKPRLWSLTSLADRPTCWGQPVTVRCSCTTGTAVHYAWYRKEEDVLLSNTSDLRLHCDTLDHSSNYYCSATNDISHQRSDIVSVQLLIPGYSSCIYVIAMSSKYRPEVHVHL